MAQDEVPGPRQLASSATADSARSKGPPSFRAASSFSARSLSLLSLVRLLAASRRAMASMLAGFLSGWRVMAWSSTRSSSLSGTSSFPLSSSGELLW